MLVGGWLILAAMGDIPMMNICTNIIFLYE